MMSLVEVVTRYKKLCKLFFLNNALFRLYDDNA